jgi:hypothetical protein
MSEMSDIELDEVVARELRGRLDPQVGRALAAFERELAAEQSRRRRWRIGAWATGSVAAAAAVALAWGMFGGDGRGGRTAPSPVPRVVMNVPAPTRAGASPVVPVLESAEWSAVIDDGTGVVNDRPVRRLRQRMVEEVEWYDPSQRATVRTTIPRERIVLIGMKTD